MALSTLRKRKEKRQRESPLHPSEESDDIGPVQATSDGPRNMDESDLWPDKIMDSLARSGLLSNFLETFGEGIHMSSDYSGIGTAEEAAKCLFIAAEERRKLMQELPPKLHVQRSGDKDVPCRQVLLYRHGRHRWDPQDLAVPRCVFGDIGERCDADIWATLTERLERIKKSEVLQAEVNPTQFAKECLDDVLGLTWTMSRASATSICRNASCARCSPPSPQVTQVKQEQEQRRAVLQAQQLMLRETPPGQKESFNPDGM